MKTLAPFHLAFPVTSLARARAFYGDVLGCAEGRSSDEWVDFDFFGHQIVAHLAAAGDADAPLRSPATHAVDGDAVPLRHFGVVLPMHEWTAFADKLTRAGVKFLIEPHVRFRGEVGEQATMFFLDPCGNALELKAFHDLGQLFARARE